MDIEQWPTDVSPTHSDHLPLQTICIVIVCTNYSKKNNKICKKSVSDIVDNFTIVQNNGTMEQWYTQWNNGQLMSQLYTVIICHCGQYIL